MSASPHPSKQVVREYLQRRSRDVKPPPTPEEIRRQLGWGMLLPDLKLATSRTWNERRGGRGASMLVLPGTRIVQQKFRQQEKAHDQTNRQ
jgi:hypothetical protein